MCRTLVSFGCRFPVLSTYDRQAHLTLLIDVRVIDLCFKCDLRRFKRVFCRECDLNPESTFIVWRVVLKNTKGHMQNDSIQRAFLIGYSSLMHDINAINVILEKHICSIKTYGMLSNLQEQWVPARSECWTRPPECCGNFSFQTCGFHQVPVKHTIWSTMKKPDTSRIADRFEKP